MSKPSECFEDTTTERKLGSVVHGPRCFHPRVGLTNAGFKLPVLPLVSPDQLLNPSPPPPPSFTSYLCPAAPVVAVVSLSDPIILISHPRSALVGFPSMVWIS